MHFLSFSDNVPQDADIIKKKKKRKEKKKKKNVDYFKTAHKTGLILV